MALMILTLKLKCVTSTSNVVKHLSDAADSSDLAGCSLEKQIIKPSERTFKLFFQHSEIRLIHADQSLFILASSHHHLADLFSLLRVGKFSYPISGDDVLKYSQ